ncbi:hypothetical protein GLYMA_10G018450v4 [Glycine max]|nr:hypothetical protein GLYMA_10G018450v4 [Glycine max]KAH1136293.1 hypothetical protein GYH30_026682 [Glycine max]
MLALYLNLLHLFWGSLLHIVEPKWIPLNNEECVRKCVVNISFQPNMHLRLLITPWGLKYKKEKKMILVN